MRPGGEKGWLAATCVFALAALVAIPACLPAEWYRPVGTLIRRAEDLSPERLLRLRIWLGALAAALAALGLALRLHPEYFVAWRRGFGAEAHGWP
ncbi:MAG TPA: hypothetical protein VNC50_12340, partial [Planctomycetia bacterium]|nr:hypothetical protein [Planctomycetia bacterium]